MRQDIRVEFMFSFPFLENDKVRFQCWYRHVASLLYFLVFMGFGLFFASIVLMAMMVTRINAFYLSIVSFIIIILPFIIIQVAGLRMVRKCLKNGNAIINGTEYKFNPDDVDVYLNQNGGIVIEIHSAVRKDIIEQLASIPYG